MPLPAKGLINARELLTKWEISDDDLACYAFEKKISLRIVARNAIGDFGVFEIHEGRRRSIIRERRSLFGSYAIKSEDAWSILKDRYASVKELQPEGEYDFVIVSEPRDGIRVRYDELYITAEELERFETAASASGDDAKSVAAKATPRGAPPKHDWVAAFIYLTAYAYAHGWPDKQADYVRVMEDWFATQPGESPDQRTIEKKVSHLFRQIDRMMAQSDAKVATAIRGRK